MRHTLLALGLTLVGSGLLLACSGSSTRVGTTSSALASLVPLADCSAVEESLREVAIAEMNRQIDAALESTLKYRGYGCYGGGGGADAGMAYGPSAGGSSNGTGSGGASPPPSAPTDDTGKGASSVSGTNNQVAGVDEPDFVKNDDKYFYVAKGSTLRIVEAWPAPGMHELSRVDVEGTARELFVDKDRAVVYSSVPQPSSDPNGAVMPSYGNYSTGGRSCTYGYDCQITGDGTATVISVFDLSNRAAPALVRTIHLSGSYINARRIGDAVHTVVSSPGIEFTGLRTYPDSDALQCPPFEQDGGYDAPVRAAFDDLRRKNEQIIRSTPLRTYFPSMTDSAAGAGGDAACRGFYKAAIGDGASFTSVVSLDLASSTPASTTTIVSRPGAVYASEGALYMAVSHAHDVDTDPWFDGAAASEKEASTIHKFHLGTAPGDTSYQGSGVVKGHVLNQFSMDEYDGNLRVATSTSQPPDPSTHSTLSILSQDAQGLRNVGAVDHIAPTEDIRSVRFDGPRGFVVTFKKTDPLFSFDLSNPSSPALVGELQIPGFSTYMHMMDDTHLLTIGYDADDQGSFAWFAGIRLQIFDVSNPKVPALLHAEVIGTRGSSSEALSDHLAFNYFKDKNLLALPMTICEGGSAGTYGTNMTFSGLMVYDVTVQGGFSLRGRVAHPSSSPSNGSRYDDAACSNWWAEASSEVKRSVFMDDVVFSISDSRIKANSLGSLSTDISELSL